MLTDLYTALAWWLLHFALAGVATLAVLALLFLAVEWCVWRLVELYRRARW